MSYPQQYGQWGYENIPNVNSNPYSATPNIPTLMHRLHIKPVPAYPHPKENLSLQDNFAQSLVNWHREVAEWVNDMRVFIAQFEEVTKVLNKHHADVHDIDGITIVYEAVNTPEVAQAIQEAMRRANIRVGSPFYSMIPDQQAGHHPGAIRIAAGQPQAQIQPQTPAPAQGYPSYSAYPAGPSAPAQPHPSYSAYTAGRAAASPEPQIKERYSTSPEPEDVGDNDIQNIFDTPLGFDPRTDPRYMHFPLPIIAARTEQILGSLPPLPANGGRKDTPPYKSKPQPRSRAGAKSKASGAKTPAAKKAAGATTTGRVTKPRTTAVARKAALEAAAAAEAATTPVTGKGRKRAARKAVVEDDAAENPDDDEGMEEDPADGENDQAV